MKLKYINVFAAMAVMAVASTSCKDSNDDNGGLGNGAVEVEITTDVETKANVTTEYTAGDAMNVYVKSYNSVESNDKVRGVRAELKDGKWVTTPRVGLKEGEVAFFFAASPYSADYTDGAKLPIDISKQIDLLYSGGSSAANFSNPRVKFNMKHAMALASFNILGAGNNTVNNISIVGDKFYTKGTFNVEKGTFTGISQDQYTHPCNQVISENGWTENYPQMWVIPFNTKTSAAQLVATIDGKTYTADFPEVEMRNGFQYIFRLVFTSLGLEFIPSMTETISLNVASDEFGELKDYGQLSFEVDGSKWTLPQLLGRSVFGKVGIGANAFGYKADQNQVIELPSATGNTVVIESWNSTGFELESLDGVTTIDISGY